jgi:hypothetical protein
MQLPCKTPSRALNAMLSAIVHARGRGLGKMAHCSTYLVCSVVSFPRDRAILIKPNPEEPVRLVIPRLAVVPGHAPTVRGGAACFTKDAEGSVFHRYTTNARRHRPYEHSLQTILTSHQRAGMKVVADNSGSSATKSTRTEDSAQSANYSGQKSSSGEVEHSRGRIWKHCPRRVHSGARPTLKVVLVDRLRFGWC